MTRTHSLDPRKIELICGCMFSGKTTELIERIKAVPKDQRLVCLKPCIDNRYSKSDIVTHDGDRIQAQAVPAAKDMLQAAAGADLVAIDEIHFLDDSFVDICVRLAAQGVRVICCGLDRDMWGDPFPHVQRLSHIASTTRMYATCAKCGEKADRTYRKIPLLNGNLVGGAEAFEPRCESCFQPPDAPKPQTQVPGLA